MVTSSVVKKDKAITTPRKRSVEEIIQSAGRVIAPLWPIATFAARNPWMGLEKHSFDQVAAWLKASRDVDMYPGASMILSAKEQGEIDGRFLNSRLEEWLRQNTYQIPKETAYRFCQAALSFEPVPKDIADSPELEKAASLFAGMNEEDDSPEYGQPLSTRVKNGRGEQLVQTLDQHVIKWSKLYLDDSQAAWEMPNRDKGLYKAWLQLAKYDPAFSKQQRKSLYGWPEEADAALTEALTELNIPESAWQDYVEGHLLSLPGWAGMMQWRSSQSAQEKSLLKEYAAVRLSIEWLLLKPFLPLEGAQNHKEVPVKKFIASWMHWGELTFEQWSSLSFSEQNDYIRFASQFTDQVRRKLWLEAWELTHENRLRQKLSDEKSSAADEKATLAQLAFCIDVRSEPFRRQLEQAGPFETIGIAGFFGLPIATSELGSRHSHASLPVILNPQHHIKEQADKQELTMYQDRKQTVESFGSTFKTMKQSVVSSLLLPELSGPWLSLQMAARSFIPTRADRFIRNLYQSWLRKPETSLSLELNQQRNSQIAFGFSDGEKVTYAEQALRMMGLTKDFAPLVVICGHGSHSTNNPYASALDCGACGGAAGGFNARVLATLCNLPEVREQLSMAGIQIPEKTVFAAAEHKTTVDELHWIHVPSLTKEAKEAFDRIEEVMPNVSQKANTERIAQLPNIDSKSKHPVAEAHRFAEDWSEIRPEWGLARNAAFIIGQRELTQESDLEGRAFLHNYDWTQDQEGSLLANIIAGPGTVTQWINLQYYASTVAPHFYGSGNKTTQTVTSGIGVMQGNASDLLAGLPWQSVMKSDDEAYHSPLRLLIVIQSPDDYIERLLNVDKSFREKVENGWIRLASVNPQGGWRSWS
ncbi:DUF2309 domain-containing protein [Jeotgalibacillus sp. R-1-5s-1]|uniref:DUF2309 domain-containing protein n=1 Tax=Jeotgalibacillus sp. R-1-5s-1 TaxID=2555897 RepID=UPI0010698D37|nr:putative inorganic carbon transporter subunit DabA [Jeotgalibacillus sp. R-1-5s-1]TFD92939.1 DUF2309 family protein [Jeotgalibacillus sp. R-1-5s-1]